MWASFLEINYNCSVYYSVINYLLNSKTLYIASTNLPPAGEFVEKGLKLVLFLSFLSSILCSFYWTFPKHPSVGHPHSLHKNPYSNIFLKSLLFSWVLLYYNNKSYFYSNGLAFGSVINILGVIMFIVSLSKFSIE